MGIDADCKLKLCFIGDGHFNKPHRANDVTKQIICNSILGDATHINELGYSIKPKYGIVTFDIDDRNFWLERWGLIALRDNIDSWKKINALPEVHNFLGNMIDFCKSMKCLLDISTSNEYFHEERYVVGSDGKVLFTETNDGILTEDAEGGTDVKWSNPNYGSKTFEEIIEEHYEEYAIHNDLHP